MSPASEDSECCLQEAGRRGVPVSLAQSEHF